MHTVKGRGDQYLTPSHIGNQQPVGILLIRRQKRSSPRRRRATPDELANRNKVINLMGYGTDNSALDRSVNNSNKWQKTYKSNNHNLAQAESTVGVHWMVIYRHTVFGVW